jgi:hypothetical protein
MVVVPPGRRVWNMDGSPRQKRRQRIPPSLPPVVRPKFLTELDEGTLRRVDGRSSNW